MSSREKPQEDVDSRPSESEISQLPLLPPSGDESSAWAAYLETLQAQNNQILPPEKVSNGRELLESGQLKPEEYEEIMEMAQNAVGHSYKRDVCELLERHAESSRPTPLEFYDTLIESRGLQVVPFLVYLASNSDGRLKVEERYLPTLLSRIYLDYSHDPMHCSQLVIELLNQYGYDGFAANHEVQKMIALYGNGFAQFALVTFPEAIDMDPAVLTILRAGGSSCADKAAQRLEDEEAFLAK